MTFCRVENVRHLEPPEQAHILGRLPVGEDDAGEHLHTGGTSEAANDPSVFTIMEKAPTRAFWLTAPTAY